MRIHVDDALGRRVKEVRLNGKVAKRCVEVDSTEGWVVVLVPATKIEKMLGIPYHHRAKRGKVEIVFEDGSVA